MVSIYNGKCYLFGDSKELSCNFSWNELNILSATHVKFAESPIISPAFQIPKARIGHLGHIYLCY